eukprot:TRINITY_DN34583_c0_g1_i1.p1 TRINITY_DN34583_c0_g1~~TRINITY_DN34583_c0_g1_i1.p1  ORF type:complete len:384 (+),score=72.14 TRINITY_DN34583_c0_g1_i1:115-1152(+)
MAGGFIDGALESDHLLLLSLFDHWEKLGGKGSSNARTWCRTNCLDGSAFETVADMRMHLLGVLVEQGFITRRQMQLEMSSKPKESKEGASPGSNRWNSSGKTDSYISSEQNGDEKSPQLWRPPCLASVTAATEEFDRRKRQLLRSLICASLWPNIVIRKPDSSLFGRNQTGLTFHPMSILGLQDAEAAEAQAGDWNCPSCGFFCFAYRESCPQCETSKPLPGQQKKVRQLRHRAFMYSEKVRSVANPGQGGKSQTHIKDASGVSTKALFLLGHRVSVDYLSGRACVDGWIHSQAAPRDVSLLLGLRRRLQQVLSRRLSQPSAEAPSGSDPEIIDAVTSALVMDVE